MADLSLLVKTRELKGKKIDQLREQGKIPAILYGHKIKPQKLITDYHKFEKIYQTAGESTLIDLVIDDQKPVKVLIQDIQKDPTSNKFLHVDFRQVRMDEELRTEIELKFIGEPPAVKELSGILITNISTLEVECLPKDLVHEIEVDLSKLKTFDDIIHVSDIKVPEGITILDSADEVVALVQEPRSEEELKGLEEKPIEAEAAEMIGEEEEKEEAKEKEEMGGAEEAKEKESEKPSEK